MLRSKLSVALVGLGLATLTVNSQASVIADSTNLPPSVGQYRTPSEVHAEYNGLGLQVILSDIRHFGFGSATHLPSGCTAPVPGPCETETFNSTVQGLFSVNGSVPAPFSLGGPVTVLLNADGFVYLTEMLQLDLTGTVGGNTVLVRENPNVASLGETNITPLGGGQFRITSFFDIFTELSLDEGQTWLPSNGSTHVELVMPEPATISLLGGALIALALVARRRNRKS